MHRTQVLLDTDLYEAAVRLARARSSSLGELVREALRTHLERSACDPVVDRLTNHPFDDRTSEKDLAVDVDHFLYGSPRRSRRSKRR